MADGRRISIGKIDVELYRCVAPSILTDEVIITEKQIQHIYSTHPESAQRSIIDVLQTVIEQPDYILQDIHASHIHDTAIVMKRVRREGGGYRVILRLITATEDLDRKNSIITAFYISEKKWSKYLRNKIILYKRL